jgi:hypothetical protein
MPTTYYGWDYIDSGVADKSTQMNSVLDDIDSDMNAISGSPNLIVAAFYPGLEVRLYVHCRFRR